MRILTILIGSFLFLSGTAQRLSQKTIWTIDDLTDKSVDHIDQKWVEQNASYYPVYKVYGEFCLSMVGLKNENFQEADLKGLAYVGSSVGNVVTIKFPIRYLSQIDQIKNIEYLEVADRLGGMALERSAKDTRVDSVWMGYGLSQPFTGKNVLIGITDWGFDYNHPMFMDTTLTTSRVRAAWDQPF